MKVHETKSGYEGPRVVDEVFEFILKDGIAVIMNLCYEKPWNFCYVCGLIGLTKASCSKHFERGYVEGDKKWGPYLRVDYIGPIKEEIDNPMRRGRQGGRAGSCNASCNNNTTSAVFLEG